MGGGGVKNTEKLMTSFMNAALYNCYSLKCPRILRPYIWNGSIFISFVPYVTDDRKLKNAPKQNFSRSILPFSGVHRTLGLLWHQQVVWFHYRQFTQSCQPVSSLLTVSPKRWQFHSYLFFMLLLEGSFVNHVIIFWVFYDPPLPSWTYVMKLSFG